MFRNEFIYLFAVLENVFKKSVRLKGASIITQLSKADG